MKKYSFIFLLIVVFSFFHSTQPAQSSNNLAKDPALPSSKTFKRELERVTYLRNFITNDPNLNIFILEEKFPWLFKKDFFSSIEKSEQELIEKRCILEQMYELYNQRYKEEIHTFLYAKPEIPPLDAKVYNVELIEDKTPEIIENLKKKLEQDDYDQFEEFANSLQTEEAFKKLADLRHKLTVRWFNTIKPYIKKRYKPLSQSFTSKTLLYQGLSPSFTNEPSSTYSSNTSLQNPLLSSLPDQVPGNPAKKVTFDVDESNKIKTSTFHLKVTLKELLIMHGEKMLKDSPLISLIRRDNTNIDLLWDEINQARKTLNEIDQEQIDMKKLRQHIYQEEDDE